MSLFTNRCNEPFQKWQKTLFMGLGFFFMCVSLSIIVGIIGLLYKEKKRNGE
jgi:hypothetical protein